MNVHVVILAAGQGKRMHSSTPKVLHEVGGKSMLLRVVETAKALLPEAVHVVYGHDGAKLQDALGSVDVHWVLQESQLGTGHALLQALEHIPKAATVLVLSADVPLLRVETLRALVDEPASLALLVAHVPEPFGLGRILRDSAQALQAIVEQKDATDAERAIKEIYTGICKAQAADLMRWLPQLGCDNAQKEYYLTEIIAMAVAEKERVATVNVADVFEVQGINDRWQLQIVERHYQEQHAKQLMLQGTTVADARRIDIRGTLHCGEDVFIDVSCIFNGKVVLGNHCSIGPHCMLTDVTIEDNTQVFANSVLEGAHIGPNCHIGPFARIRAGTRLAAACKIGNFVETKKALLGEDSKASHLSYLGDVIIGKDVNIGAGTITCNYDGVDKHQTIIEDGAFIGSDTQLVAPVRVGKNATLGAGSTLRKDAPPNELTITEARQKTLYGWKRAEKKT